VTTGIASAKGRGGMGIVDYEDFIQTDASINPGNSGGALVDAEGRLIGINTAILSRSGGNQGIGFAVPINLARYILERIISEGKVTRGYLGIMIQPVTPDLAREFKLPEQTGALVGEVTPKSPAEEAGLKEGDVIVEFNGKKVTDPRQLRLTAAQTPPGTRVTLKTIRDGKDQTATLKLGELPSNSLAKASPSGRDSDKGAIFDGVDLANLEPTTRRRFNIPSQVREGALVANLDRNSPAAAAGLQPGDVILEINRRPVTNADQAIEMTKGSRGDRALLRIWSDGGSRYVVIDAGKRK
jgi:serine protease Do